jgi:hypothetical protein
MEVSWDINWINHDKPSGAQTCFAGKSPIHDVPSYKPPCFPVMFDLPPEAISKHRCSQRNQVRPGALSNKLRDEVPESGGSSSKMAMFDRLSPPI